MIRATHIALTFTVLAALSGPAGAEQAQSPGVPSGFGKGDQKLSLTAGYGPAFGDPADDVSDVQLVPVIGSWSIGLSDVVGQDRWYQGNWEALLEGQYLTQIQPKSGWGAGGTINVRYNFLPSPRWVPYVGIGAGMGHIDFRLESQADDFNFFLQGGVGTHYVLNERWALTAEARYHHISNAQTRNDNAGINTILFLVGTTFSLE